MNIEKIIEVLKERNFEINSSVGTDTYYLDNDGDVILSIVSPHEGSRWQWILRADYKSAFDRWSNCWFEEFFNDYDSYNKVISNLDDFIKSRELNLATIGE